MKHVLDITAHTLTFRYVVDDESVVPDSGVVYDLRGHDGAIINAAVAVSTDAATTESQVTIASGDNTLTGGALLSNRYVVLTFAVGGQTYQLKQNYVISAFVNTTATPDDVRSVLSLDVSELPDDDIDILGAYFRLQEDVTVAILAAALDNVLLPDLSTQANKAIVLKASLELLPTLQLRVIQREKFNTNERWRLAKMDFEKIEADLSDQLSDAILFMQEADATTPTMLLLGNRTPDPFTGV